MARKDHSQDDFSAGMHAFLNNHYEDSTTSFSRVIDNDPHNRLALVSRGAAYLQLMKFREAEDDFDRAIAIDARSPKPFHLRGLVRDRQGHSREALDDFSQAIERDPEYGAAYYSRSAVYTRLGEHAKAREDIEAFTLLTEKNVAGYAAEHNVWRSHHMTLEDGGITDPMHR
jgi:tetratricopeptide (TPR) repeat protein